jgi:hypothetical protein
MLRLFFINCFFILFFASCAEKQNEKCNNPDAVNYESDGAIESSCIYPKEKITGAWAMRVDEYPLDGSLEGEMYSFDMRDNYCYGPLNSYRYVRFFALQSPFEPADFCLQLNGFNFEIDSSMNVRFRYDPVTGTGSFANEVFEFNGTVYHNGIYSPFKLGGGR